MGVPVLVVVSAAVINLYEAHAALNEPPRDQTLPAERSRADRLLVFRRGGVNAVHLLGLHCFLRKVKSLRRCRLQLKCQLVARDSRLEFGVTGSLGLMLGV